MAVLGVKGVSLMKKELKIVWNADYGEIKEIKGWEKFNTTELMDMAQEFQLFANKRLKIWLKKI